jgi:hypothetical protein
MSESPTRSLTFIGLIIPALMAKPFDRMDEKIAYFINPAKDGLLIIAGNRTRGRVPKMLSPH